VRVSANDRQAGYLNGKLVATANQTLLTEGSDGGNETLAVGLATSFLALVQGTPTFTVGAEAGNVRNVSVQLKDAGGTNLAAKHLVHAWLSDTDGGTLAATAPDGAVAIGTNGVIVKENTTKKEWTIITSAAGVFDLNIGESTAKTFYLCVEYQGKVHTQAVAFA
jgi:hypothetical protein